MARWDEILTLPVQNPPTLEFSSADLVWSKVEGWRDSIDRVALIPFDRVDDFVRGESSKDCPTRFHVEARRRRPPQAAYKPKVDGILEYILYWCSFGPDDHRKGGVVRPSRVYTCKRKTPAGRPNTKRGCVCHFIVKRLIAEPTVALIIYNQEKHVDKKGLPCHGPMDKKAVGTNAMFAPYISDELRSRVLSLLYVGVTVETIMQKHNEFVEKQGGPCNRDDLLTHRYVRRLERSIRRSTHELDPDDATSVSMWVENHRSHVFFYEDFSESEPFVLGIQTEWQLQQMIRFGNRSLVASDSRFGTNKLKYPVHSILVFNSNNEAIPVAWIIAPRFASSDAYKWIRALYNRVHLKDPTWKLAGFIVDDPSADIHTIRDVFQCSILVCFWRVRHAWHKNLVEQCSDTNLCSEIFRSLGQVIYGICKENVDLKSFEDFMEDFIDCTTFLDYFKAVWFPRMGSWIQTLKTLPLASQEISAAVESYHHQFKIRLVNEKNPFVYQRVDWLVDKLTTKVHSYYWLDEYPDKDNFSRYHKDEWKSGLTSWHLAMDIPDSDVVLESRCAKVTSQHDREKMYIVQNPGSEYALCECKWSRLGNLCKHVIKASQICRRMGLSSPSINLVQYNRMLMNMLHSPPCDSLIQDHAVTMAVCAQMQLNSIFGVGDRTFPSFPPEEPTVNSWVYSNGILENQDKHVTGGSQCATEHIFSNGILGNQDEFATGGSQCATEHISSNGNDTGIPCTVQVGDNEIVGDIKKSTDNYGDLTSNAGTVKATEIGPSNAVCGDASEETDADIIMKADQQSPSTCHPHPTEPQPTSTIFKCGEKHSRYESSSINASRKDNSLVTGEAKFHVVAEGHGSEATEISVSHNSMDADMSKPFTVTAMDADDQTTRTSPAARFLNSPDQQHVSVDLAASAGASRFVVIKTVTGKDEADPHPVLTSADQHATFNIDTTKNDVCGDLINNNASGYKMDADQKSLEPGVSSLVATKQQPGSNHMTSNGGLRGENSESSTSNKMHSNLQTTQSSLERLGSDGQQAVINVLATDNGASRSVAEETGVCCIAVIDSDKQTVIDFEKDNEVVCYDVAKEIVIENSMDVDVQAIEISSV